MEKRMSERKTNWVAILMVAVLLVDILLGTALLAGGYYYLGGDLSTYYEACQERAVLAEGAEKEILYRGTSTTPIDLGKMEEKAEEINNKVQTLADRTDLGEHLAENDLTAEGRDDNKVVMYSIFAMFVVGVIYLLMQLSIVVVFIAKACGKKKNNSYQGGAAA